MEAERQICLGEGLASIPFGLLRAQSEGKVLFIVGSGVSHDPVSRLPLFPGLVKEVFRQMDFSVFNYIRNIEGRKEFKLGENPGMTDTQQAEIKAFCEAEYDVALGLLERRTSSNAGTGVGSIRHVVEEIIRDPSSKPSPVHESIIKLSDRGSGIAVVTTNFDLLLEKAAKKLKKPLQGYSIGEIMRPSLRPEFSGILHIHGSIEERPGRVRNLILTDQDFGEYYLRGRTIPDFIYDAARLYSIVLVGYSANDPPMKYLLSAVAADHTRFGDIKPRYAFFGPEASNPIDIAHWRGRGIQPIHYKTWGNDHSVLGKTLAEWALFTPRKGREEYFKSELLRITRNRPDDVSDAERDRYELILYLSPRQLRTQLLGDIGIAGAHTGWLDLALGVEDYRKGGK